MIDKSTAEFTAILAQAGGELGLQDYYHDCVRPLLSMPTTQWPSCCGSGCEPCSQTLIAVATRVCELMNVDLKTLGL
jgi:hypothetical protein